MRDKRTSKPQIITYKNLVRYIEKRVLSLEGMTIIESDKFTAETKKFFITAELEKRIPDTKRSTDILLTIENKTTKKCTVFAIEYDCLQWHRKWKDDKKDAVLIDRDINVVRIQTYKLQPDARILWEFISKIYKMDEPQIMYYRLSDFEEDVWTGKKYRDYRTGRIIKSDPVFDYDYYY